MSGGFIHDVLSVRRTRRQMLRAALAGAALTVPLVGRAAPARAAGPSDCRKGCLWTAERRFISRWNVCVTTLGSGVFAFFYNPVVAVGRSLAAERCTDRVIVQNKADAWDCSQPNCTGFDPSGPDGPCYDCTQSGGICCPDSNQQSGYACCTRDGGCCKPDGCKSGITDCGG
jgi:hypothetical protein